MSTNPATTQPEVDDKSLTDLKHDENAVEHDIEETVTVAMGQSAGTRALFQRDTRKTDDNGASRSSRVHGSTVQEGDEED